MEHSDNRTYLKNLMYFLYSIIGIILLPTIFTVFFLKISDNEYLCNILGELLFIITLIVIYFKDLKVEFKNFTKGFKKNFGNTIKYYICGLLLMIVFNIIINVFIKGLSENETIVRDTLYSYPLYMMINISLIAPICEELVFRKSINTIIKNKWLYCLACGLLFGFAHIITNFMSGTFVISDLLYLLPYGTLGFFFAYMDYETKSTFNSMIIHSIHNTCTGILLLVYYNMGLL